MELQCRFFLPDVSDALNTQVPPIKMWLRDACLPPGRKSVF